MSVRKEKCLRITEDELQAFQQRVVSRQLLDTDYELILRLSETIEALRQALAEKEASIGRLCKYLLGAPTETARNILKDPKAPKVEDTAEQPEKTGSVYEPDPHLPAGRDQSPEIPRVAFKKRRRPGESPGNLSSLALQAGIEKPQFGAGHPLSCTGFLNARGWPRHNHPDYNLQCFPNAACGVRCLAGCVFSAGTPFFCFVNARRKDTKGLSDNMDVLRFSTRIRELSIPGALLQGY